MDFARTPQEFVEGDPQVVRSGPISAIVTVVVLVAALCGISGCARTDLIPKEEYVGVLQLAGPDGYVATLLLNQDGSLAVRGAPRVLFALGDYETPDWAHPVDLDCEWEVAGIAKTLVWTELGGTYIHADGNGDEMTIKMRAEALPTKAPFSSSSANEYADGLGLEFNDWNETTLDSGVAVNGGFKGWANEMRDGMGSDRSSAWIGQEFG